MFQTTNQVSYPLVILHGKGHPFKIIPFKSLKNFGVCPHPYQPHCWWNLKVLKSQGFLGSTTRLHGQIPLLARPKRATKGARIFQLVKFIQIDTCPAKIPCSVSTIPTIPIK